MRVGGRPRRSVATWFRNRAETIHRARRASRARTHGPPAAEGGAHEATARARAVGRGCSGRVAGPRAAAADGTPDGLNPPVKNPKRVETMKTSLLATLVLCAAALPAQEDNISTSVVTTLTNIRNDPEAFRNVKVNFTAQFASLG